MALVKSGHQLENATFTFDDAGELVDVQIQVNYAIADDATGEEQTRVRKTLSIWDQLPPGVTQSAANSFGKRAREIAEQV